MFSAVSSYCLFSGSYILFSKVTMQFTTLIRSDSRKKLLINSLVLIGVVFLWLLYLKIFIPPLPYDLSGDAIDYMRAGYNIQKHGILDDNLSDQVTDLRPTAHREPLYPLFLGLAMKLSGEYNVPTSRLLTAPQGKKANFLIRSYDISIFQAIILFLTACLTFFIAKELSNSYGGLIAFVGVLFSPTLLSHCFNFFAEGFSAFVLMIHVLCFYLFFRKRKPEFLFMVGLSLGFLILTRAIYQYLWLFEAIILVWYEHHDNKNWKKTIESIALFLFALAIILSPWLVRNYNHFDKLFVTERGGIVLSIRAQYNQMTTKEYWTSFLWWTPSKATRQIRRSYFEKDELNRLDRREKQGYYQRAKQQKRDYVNRLKSSLEADKQLYKEAITQILSSPLKHVMVSIPFAWRGLFVEKNFTPSMREANSAILLNFVYLFAFILFLYFSYKKRKIIHFLIMVPLFYHYTLHVLVTHNLPRYNRPLLPLLWVAVSVVLIQISGYFRNPINKNKD